jgi:predicted transposase YdaD
MAQVPSKGKGLSLNPSIAEEGRKEGRKEGKRKGKRNTVYFPKKLRKRKKRLGN